MDKIQSTKPLQWQKNLVFGVYVLQALSLFLGITFLIGAVINYLKRDSLQGTWLASHFQWQIGTFWVGLLLIIIGALTTFLFFGYLILLFGYFWIIYRVVIGWLRFNEGKEIK